MISYIIMQRMLNICCAYIAKRGVRQEVTNREVVDEVFEMFVACSDARTDSDKLLIIWLPN